MRQRPVAVCDRPHEMSPLEAVLVGLSVAQDAVLQALAGGSGAVSPKDGYVGSTPAGGALTWKV